MKKVFSFSFALIALIIIATSGKAQTTVFDVIQNSEDHDTLETAITQAELDDDLSGAGPFTVFAPTDAAFDALPDGVLSELLSDPTGELAQILLYHVANGKVMSGDLTDGQMITTLQGKDVEVTIDNGSVYINDAMVTVADIEASNGVVHVIDAVLSIPQTVVDVIVESEAHDTLETAVTEAGLVDDLSGEGPFTVFAPTDAAFDALPDGVLDDLLADPTGDLAKILLYHVAEGKVMSGDLSDGQMIMTLKGQEVEVTISNGDVFINGAKVTVADIEADNGVVHVIDAVMLPDYDVQISETTEFGQVMTDKDGNTLYYFTKDAADTSACAGNCIDNWPAFHAANLYLPPELNQSDFEVITRSDGARQLTYKGWPLYYFVNDENPGDINGDGVNNMWYVANPNYTIMMVDNQLVGADGKMYTGDYEQGEEILQYFTDGSGITLYTWINDNYQQNNFTAEDFSNNNIWPIYEEEDIVLPSALNESNFDTIHVHGRTQLTYKGYPLYYFGNDNGERGSTKGVSVPSPGVWPVPVADMKPAPYPTVADVIVESEAHDTLETAVTEAGLVDDLSGEGPFTVFAPTDAAFAALPDGVLDDLLADPTGELAQILLYHVANGKVMSGDLSDGQMITTLQGNDISVTIDGGNVFINDAQVTIADIEADNGVVHVIDGVLSPDDNATFVERLKEMDVKVYPNPASNYLHVALDETAEHIISLYSLDGTLIRKTSNESPRFELNVSDLDAGVYMLEIQNGERASFRKVLIR